MILHFPPRFYLEEHGKLHWALRDRLDSQLSVISMDKTMLLKIQTFLEEDYRKKLPEGSTLQKPTETKPTTAS